MSNEFIVKFRSFDKVECCFDIVAVLATMSNEVSLLRQSRNKLIMFNLFRLRRTDEISFDIVAKNGSNNVEATFNFVERIVRLIAFDNAVSTLLLCGRGLTVVLTIFRVLIRVFFRSCSLQVADR